MVSSGPAVQITLNKMMAEIDVNGDGVIDAWGGTGHGAGDLGDREKTSCDARCCEFFRF